MQHGLVMGYAFSLKQKIRITGSLVVYLQHKKSK